MKYQDKVIVINANKNVEATAFLLPYSRNSKALTI